ncbi:MAG TPA: tetraacyldisaccharide 4'-kinase [Gammaproteobacteria bacterium]|nr:tetraacyldisaccharide 4'-kinase [Gammaproteobacteria bacterium]
MRAQHGAGGEAGSEVARPGGGWRGRLEAALTDAWYHGHPALLPLWPLGLLWATLAAARRAAHANGLLHSTRLPLPVIVVGNLTVGGTGKTPLTIWLAEQLRARGYRIGIVSRGHGGRATEWPQIVRPDSDPDQVGDEAVLIARRTGCPMAVGPDRVAAAEALIEWAQPDLLLSDDGLQHYALARDLEIVVVDGVRRFGNRRCLPAGPLRESESRLATVDLVICNGGSPRRGEFGMQLLPRALVPVLGGQERPPTSLAGERVHCVTGIGHPERFFATLRGLGARVIAHAFPDHHRFRREDLDFGDDAPVVMTEKDAVKCERFADRRHWYLAVEASPSLLFTQRLDALLKELNHGQETPRNPRLPGDQGPAHPR